MVEQATKNLPQQEGGIVVLDLDVDNRPQIKIDGTGYRVSTRHLLPPLELHHLSKLGRRLAELVQKEDASEDEQRELGDLPNRIVRAVLDAPDAIHQKLNDQQRMAIITAIFN
jgi:hypothetical protein